MKSLFRLREGKEAQLQQDRHIPSNQKNSQQRRLRSMTRKTLQNREVQATEVDLMKERVL
jgi:hypothetical protein